MKILSMTATFGKLERETLTLQPGLNVIHAPNEWGKSTWCAFLVAMLYGIETRVHTTKTVLADKERYAPWSGSPMSGRIDLNWQGRNITIERSSKGRSIFGVFRAYETDTGLEIPELTAANCGQTLLGVEKSVFLRSGFLRLADLPVTQDESLRRRLNAMVTTGDESGTADVLAQKLKELKNRCRLNKSTGLLPQAQLQQKQLADKLEELQQLQEQSARIQQRLEELEQHHALLLNHRDALTFAANRSYQERLTAAENALTAAREKEDELRRVCRELPAPDKVEQMLLRLRQLRESRDAMHMEAQMLPQAPQMPEQAPVFQGVEPQAAISAAENDAQIYAENSRKRSFPWYCLLLALLGAAAFFVPDWIAMASGGVLLVLAAVLLVKRRADSKKRKNTCRALQEQYGSIPPEEWVSAAGEYAASLEDYHSALKQYENERYALDQRITLLNEEITALTGGVSLSQKEAQYHAARQSIDALLSAQREARGTEELVHALRASHKEAPAPKLPDSMTYSEAETARLLSDCQYEQRQLQLRLGQCQGRMEALGQESALRQQLDTVNQRITALEDAYAAMEIAQSTLLRATAELQRRFAPRIAGRAQELFGKLTDGRYTRLTLDEDLAVHAAAEEENVLHSALWRSEGTVDQLYLALRLAMAEELTPEAPLVLDDALVRFDDKRLREALDVLSEEAEMRQVILFTCQSREASVLSL